MKKIENTEENRLKLAENIVEDWDLETLMSFAVETLEAEYKINEEGFANDWKDTFDS